MLSDIHFIAFFPVYLPRPSFSFQQHSSDWQDDSHVFQSCDLGQDIYAVGSRDTLSECALCLNLSPVYRIPYIMKTGEVVIFQSLSREIVCHPYHGE